MDILGIHLSPVFVSEVSALLSVILIDLVLAGDNAVVVGMAAAGLPVALRRKAIVIGIASAAVLRIIFAIFATQILGILGLLFAGGLLLLWVGWKLWREIRSGSHAAQAAATDAPDVEIEARHDRKVVPGAAAAVAERPTKTFGQALTQIVVADVSMSLDNVLAVAGIARQHLWVLAIGLCLSVALMGVAATFVASLLKRYPWISYVGFALIFWVALKMIWDGGWEIYHAASQAGVV